MSTIITTREIDLCALATELGGVELTMIEAGGERTITCLDTSVSTGTLQTAVNAHVPPPSPPSLQEQIDELKGMLG